MSHESEHRRLDAQRSEIERLRKEQREAHTYTGRASLQAVFNWKRSQATIDIEDHVRKTHGVVVKEPWPLYEELLFEHNRLHEAGMPPCSTAELVEALDVNLALEASLRERGLEVP